MKGIKNTNQNVSDPNLTPEMVKQIKRGGLKKHLNDDTKILDNNSRSVQTWSCIPRFHHDIINGKNFEKKKRAEKLEKSLKKQNQKGIGSFLETDPYHTKAVVMEEGREVLDKIKSKHIGINNHKSLANCRKKQDEKKAAKEEKAKSGIFGLAN